MKQKQMFKPEGLRTITHSSVECFQECRRKWFYRYERELIPTETQTALGIGTAVHAGLEFWFKFGSLPGAVQAAAEAGAYTGLDTESQIKVQAMIERYTEVYEQEAFTVVEVEKTFKAPLRNPITFRASRTFELWGKVDAIVKAGEAYYILEHKTTADISEAYLKAIDIKPQTVIYAAAIEEALGIPVRGAIYDILEKPGIRMAKGETEDEFEARRAELAAKSKTGKSTAKRREADTFDSFLARCREKLTAESFRRVQIDITIERKRDVLDGLWKAARDMIRAEIYPNAGACAPIGRECPYLELCRAGGDESKCPGLYEHKDAHSELGREEKV